MTSRAGEGQTIGGDSLLARYADFVKLPHTLFGLPFAFLGVVYASFSTPVTVRHGLLVAGAFTAARFAAMGFNRITDRRFDGLNTRTEYRELPTGRLSLSQAVGSVAVASVAFLICAGLLNRLCLLLSPLALAWILGYSYTKRFTHWSHFWLGGALAIAPVGGYLAVAGSWSTPWWILIAVAGSVTLWVAGFDIFYALQDESFDRNHALKSAVVLLGKSRSIMLAKSLHGLMLIGLLIFGIGAGFGVFFYIGLVAVAGILAWEHQLVRPADLSRLDAAFFQMNGIIAVTVFAAALVDRVL